MKKVNNDKKLQVQICTTHSHQLSHKTPQNALLNRTADVIGEMVLTDQAAAKANAIKRQENI